MLLFSDKIENFLKCFKILLNFIYKTFEDFLKNVCANFI